MAIIALIPAYNPDQLLVSLVSQLSQKGVFDQIVVVNDGSCTDDAQVVFENISRLEQVKLLQHSVNLGKGAALKTGLDYIKYHFADRLVGAVTLDADGQHSVSDVVMLAKQLCQKPEHLMIGVRRFDKKVPLRSRLGNSITKYCFRFITGNALSDTQSGLRAIPVKLFKRLLKLKSNGYEFELDMLMVAHQIGVPITEYDIETIYLDDNRRSHFRPLRDSMRIYFVLLRFSLIALFSAFLDYLIFVVVYLLLKDILYAMIAARVVSICFNYLVVKRFAFHSEQSHFRTLPKYLLLALVSGGCAYFIIQGLVSDLHLNVVLSKVIAESVIFLVNFIVQRDFIFKR